MNYREKIRKAIECPQFNNTGYGEWGALNLEQRKYIKRLLDELDSADNYIKKLYFENQKQKEVIDKAIEYINKYGWQEDIIGGIYTTTGKPVIDRYMRLEWDNCNELLQILEKGDSNE